MFNMLNARKIEDELNVMAGIFNSHVFWTIWVSCGEGWGWWVGRGRGRGGDGWVAMCGWRCVGWWVSGGKHEHTWTFFPGHTVPAAWPAPDLRLLRRGPPAGSNRGPALRSYHHELN